jgi:hypothetical protein
MIATTLRFGCIAAVVLITACASTQAPSPAGSSGPGSTTGGTAPRTNAGVNLSGYPPSFKDGFSDGCESLRGNYRRDNRFGKDNNYTLGWQDGYSICGRQKR